MLEYDLYQVLRLDMRNNAKGYPITSIDREITNPIGRKGLLINLDRRFWKITNPKWQKGLLTNLNGRF